MRQCSVWPLSQSPQPILSFTQVRIVLCSYPQALSTAKASRMWWFVVHSQRMLSLWAMASTFAASAQMLSMDICGYGLVLRCDGSALRSSYGQGGSATMTRYGPHAGYGGASAQSMLA